AVTSADYELLAMNTPGLRVARAKAIPRYHPSQKSEVPGIVTVIVVPHSQQAKPKKPSVGFLKTVYTHLNKHRLLTTELFVIPPEYVDVSVDATVVIKPKYRKETVEENVRTELASFLHPIRGGIDRNGWTFGRPVYISELYEIIDRVDGVDYVKSLVLKEKDGEWQASDIDIPAHGLVYSGTHKIKAKEEKADFHG
ncbi:MAG: baseplate J/gp47 family protein, partial [Proteobacteria bacterium]|nr:baseplate J/gp47 family protein [Pseudomonadota bacterium]